MDDTPNKVCTVCCYHNHPKPQSVAASLAVNGDCLCTACESSRFSAACSASSARVTGRRSRLSSYAGCQGLRR